jgi:sporulation protein YlmC with PRC-barrel domain
MRKWNRVPVLWISLALLAGASSFSCRRSETLIHLSSLEDQLASRLLGRQVENEDGRELATLDDLLIDLQSGRVRYGILASDGFIGLGKRLKVVPANALSTETTKNNVLALDISIPIWEHAPIFNKKTVLALNNPTVAKSVEQYYQLAAKENDALLPPQAVPSTSSALTPPGQEPRRPGQAKAPSRGLTSVRAATGNVVVNRQQQWIGRIEDLLVDLSGRSPSYAIIASDELFKRDQRFAVALSLLSQGTERTFVIDATRRMFEQAQRFDPTSAHKEYHLELCKILRLSEDRPPLETEGALSAL